ncbi:MAG: NCS2 family permease [Clostridiales bacterium]|nr:NCS2 family permease [Clostridiales bacterium]
MDKFFQLKKNGTTVRTEIVAGLTTFMTMAYIIALNPNILVGFDKQSDPLWKGVFLATCIASAIGTICMAFLANKPFVMAPGMGLNSFFNAVVLNIAAITGMTFTQSFQSALVIVFIEGIIFIVLSILNIREKIVHAIPLGVRLGIGPAIGLMLMNIGFGSNAPLNGTTIARLPDEKQTEVTVTTSFQAMRDFFSSLTASSARDKLGDNYNMMILTVVTIFIGLFAIIALNHKKVKGAVLYGMMIASAIFWAGEAIFFDTNPFEPLKKATFIPPFREMADTTLFRLNFKGFMEIGWFTIITLIITFCLIDMFDTIGTLVGTASRAKMLDDKGNMPKMKEALLSDAIGTVAGSVTGTSTVTTFVESASGVEAGGRTGLSALVAGMMFLLCMFLAPLAAIIPTAATSSALIYVGILMLGNLKEIKFDDISQLAPVAVMLLAMPISGSIGHGIGLALITYTVIKLTTGKAKDVTWLTYLLSVIFILKFFVAV